MNSDERQDDIGREKRTLKYDLEVLPRRTTSILMEINNNGECRAVTSLDDSNVAAPINTDKKVCVIYLFFLNVISCSFYLIFLSCATYWPNYIGKTHINLLVLHCPNHCVKLAKLLP